MTEYLLISALSYLITTHKISYTLRNYLFEVSTVGFKSNGVFPEYHKVQANWKAWFVYKLYELLSCPFCSAFWIGVIYSCSIGCYKEAVGYGLVNGIIATVICKLT